ncbi:hypothetical protein TeGR_g10820 [Tetraparma gracilis]|uniref:Uncharacterized protein n=1 Tax=Tetraparma gracilis TaxID=2962635 RepID=A0ABQ6N4P6_9STRA|nr:hypothetical protein TeGR_g10820 [Tetraparma gracilis]
MPNARYKTDGIFDLISRRTSRAHRSYCRLGFTFEDIYPNDDYNFVYGLARLMEKTGVFSFARHSPLFDEGYHVSDVQRDSLSPTDLASLLRFTLKTMVHETAHMFQLLHCIYYQCVMNGSNGGGESASKSAFCCPVCLKKLMNCISAGAGKTVEVGERYAQMEAASEHILAALVDHTGAEPSRFKKLQRDITWLKQRRAFLSGEGAPICAPCGLPEESQDETAPAPAPTRVSSPPAPAPTRVSSPPAPAPTRVSSPPAPAPTRVLTLAALRQHLNGIPPGSPLTFEFSSKPPILTTPESIVTSLSPAIFEDTSSPDVVDILTTSPDTTNIRCSRILLSLHLVEMQVHSNHPCPATYAFLNNILSSSSPSTKTHMKTAVALLSALPLAL